MTTLRQQFRKDGYVIVSNVLTESEVAQVRSTIANYLSRLPPLLKNEDKAYLPASIMYTDEVLTQHLYNPEIVSTLTQIFGRSVTYLPDLEAQINHHDSGWHFDAQSERGNDYFYDKDYLFAKCGIYLQDNTKIDGGGIDIVPGTHKSIFQIQPRLIKAAQCRQLIKWYNTTIRDYANQRKTQREVISLPIKQGDLVVFDSRLRHRATVPEKHESSTTTFLSRLSPESKMTLYWNASNTYYAKHFLEHSTIRCNKRGYEITFGIHDTLQLTTSSFHNKFFSNLEQSGVGLQLYPNELAKGWKKRRNELLSEILGRTEFL